MISVEKLRKIRQMVPAAYRLWQKFAGLLYKSYNIADLILYSSRGATIQCAQKDGAAVGQDS